MTKINFIFAGDVIINLNELLYITKAKNKNIYIAKFKSSYQPVGGNDDSILFLSQAQYEDLQQRLGDSML